jgi:hypothetical protein
MTSADVAAPVCQMRGCEADADTSREHPEFGDVQVCETCARLWSGGES